MKLPKVHRPHRNASRRGTTNERGYTYRWQQYSKRFLREHPLCAHCEVKGILKGSTDVDHRTPVRGPNDPRFWDPLNHQALCHECHSVKTNREMRLPETAGRTKVTVVVGLPASGKTTYVLERRQPGDLIVDVDRIYAAISGLPLMDKPEGLLPFAAAARDAIYERLLRPSDVRMVWIITTDPHAANTLVRAYGAELVQLTVSEDVRQQRLRARSSRVEELTAR